MTFPDLIKDFIDTSRERIKTPITGSFMLAFLIYNWRPIFLLAFSDAKIEDKIIVINHQYCTWDAILLPLVIAIVYVAGVQYIMWGFDYLTTKAHKERKVNRYERQKHDLEKYRTVLNEQRLNENIRSGNLEIGQLNDQIEKLKNDYEIVIQNKQSEKEGFEKEIEMLTRTANEALDHMENYSETVSLYEKKVDFLIKDSSIDGPLNLLSQEQLDGFVQFVNFYIFKTSNKLTVNATFEEDYITLNLIMYTQNNYSLTQFGRKLYEYLIIK